MFNIFLLMTGAPAEGGQQSNPMITLGFFAMIFLVFYFLIIRPQQKRQKEHQAMLKSVKSGDRVLTTGGLIGNVMGNKEENGVEILVLKIAENTKVEVSRGSIASVIAKNV